MSRVINEREIEIKIKRKTSAVESLALPIGCAVFM
jgi:hypothetical protein